MTDPHGEVDLGSGLYVSFDGYRMRLRALGDEQDHVIYLEPRAVLNLLSFMKDALVSGLRAPI